MNATEAMSLEGAYLSQEVLMAKLFTQKPLRKILTLLVLAIFALAGHI